MASGGGANSPQQPAMETSHGNQRCLAGGGPGGFRGRCEVLRDVHFCIGTWQFLMGLWLLYDGLMMGLWWFEMGDWDFMMRFLMVWVLMLRKGQAPCKGWKRSMCTTSVILNCSWTRAQMQPTDPSSLSIVSDIYNIYSYIMLYHLSMSYTFKILNMNNHN